jgi:restriction system protein
MSIPTYEDLMLPLMNLLKDEKEHNYNELVTFLEKEFSLTEAEKEKRIPSGQQTYMQNRTGWARTHLKKTGLVEYPKRGVYKITKLGLQVLRENPTRIDNNFLRKFPSFVEWFDVKREKIPANLNEIKSEASKTPEESLEIAYQTIRNSLASEIIDQVKSCSPYFFERLVVELLVKMGYGGTLQEASALVTRKGSDEGIDGIIKEDRLGLDIIYIQAKRWENVVGRPEIQKFVGALAGQQAKKGVFITTSNFTKDAKNFADKIENKIILIDGEQLAEFMIDYNVGVSNVTSYELKRIDSDYFSED